jgi:hypothetical protein
MSAIDLTRAGLVRALEAAIAATPAVDRAVRSEADALAGRIADAGLAAHVVRRGQGDYAVEASGQGLFAREFGSHDAAAEPVIAPLLEPRP